ncbi:hypothetical protein ACFO1B_56830 [Dactylosporangium siamense]|uniref:MarR family transcriptional regulator n=1 Tax=Dactylosporangium siamense TaxID=685454 RepID=A0A919Q2K7_9ACTN|nr:hypothetical protein [Dactylosporangium siamense]GIG53133.1 hypothetical protein Dsi01nite_111740 [Dactylosporangium siamense]
MKAEDRPIGYWLRELDRRIEDAFMSTLDARGLTRRHWQVLNGLGPDDPFWGPGERSHPEVVADLTARGWTTPDGALTPGGERARAAIAVDVAMVRRRSAEGIPDEDYLTTVRTLARMAGNLSAG